MRRTLAVVLALFAVLAGCKKEKAEVPYESIETRPTPLAPTNGPNAFDDYARLADQAEAASTVSLDARDTAGNRRKADQDAGKLLESLSKATSHRCAFQFNPTGAFEPRPHRMGWLILSRALVWRVQAKVAEEDWSAAVGWANVGLAFGADLCGGSMADATIGYGMMDGVRAALAPYIGLMPVDVTDSLAQGTSDALARMPDPAVTIHNESLNVLKSISELQDAHRLGSIDLFAEKFHGRTVSTVKALKDLSPQERSDFFKSLINEERSLTEQLLERIATPGAKRGPVEEHLTGSAKVVFDQFAAQAEPWMAMRDREIARTRLLLATAVLTVKVARDNKTPSDLSLLGKENSIDPYTGYQLGYISYGRDFLVYSYGIDGKDDRGDSNAAQTDPDLLLEDALH